MSNRNWFSRIVSGIFKTKQDKFAKGFPSSSKTTSIWTTFESTKYVIFDEAGGTGKEFLGEDNFGGDDVCNDLISKLSKSFDCDKSSVSEQWGYSFEFRVPGQDTAKHAFEIMASFDPGLNCWKMCFWGDNSYYVPLEVAKEVNDALQGMEVTNIKWFEENPDHPDDLLAGLSAPF